MTSPTAADRTPLDDLYAPQGADPDFRTVLARLPPDDDEALADLIEADGRRRLELGRPIDLDRYHGAIPDLPARPEALDAAIDMTLRHRARAHGGSDSPIESLVREHPELETAIREAAALNNAIWSTARLAQNFARWEARSLPVAFGPVAADGSRRYELIELLGEGGFGQVYRAVDRQLSEDDHAALVSVKILPATDRTPLERERLADEATKARRIDHPNVVRVLDRGVSDDDEDFIVYEYVDGGDLGRRMRRSNDRPDRRAAVRLAAGIARGVHAAHMAGLVHCDLKPNNVVMTEQGTPKVADFGIAIRADRGPARSIDVDRDAPVGNLAFMSPEQYRMEPGSLTIPTDVYALGGILYWLLTGALPNGGSPEEIRAVHDPDRGRTCPPSPRERRPDIDRDLDAICRRAMAIRPEDRYSSAALLADDLDAWWRHEPIGWTHPGPARRLALWARRKPALAVAALVLGAVVVGSAIAVARLSSIAADRELEAALADARAKAQEQQRQRSGTALLAHMEQVRKSMDINLASEILPQIWMLEWVMGPTVLAVDDASRIRLWEMRETVVRDLLAHARAAGRGDELEGLLWESALGYWLTRDGRYAEAEPLLARNEAAWAKLLEPDDDWLDHVRTLRACAAVSRLADAPRGADRAEAERVARILADAHAALDTDAPGTPIHDLVLDRLEVLYGADLLDRPAELARVRERREELD